jgi:uncharacterized OsmC-like protein
MSTLNHINLESLRQLREEASADPTKAKLRPKIRGEWLFGEGEPQFRAVVEVEAGAFTLDADMPTRLGGGGSAPSPLHYCLYGLAACFAATYASIAAQEGVKLGHLEIKAESHIDLSRVLELADRPIAEGIYWTVRVEADARPEDLERIKRLAEERCPAVYCVTNPVKLEINLEVA